MSQRKVKETEKTKAAAGQSCFLLFFFLYFSHSISIAFFFLSFSILHLPLSISFSPFSLVQKPKFSGWAGDFGPPHTWTQREANESERFERWSDHDSRASEHA